RKDNLPHPLTSFIGHEDDLERLCALLDQTRLLTLTGIGGCGKTRLAIALGGRMIPVFSDGVWFVDLAPLSDPERVSYAIAGVLEVQERADRRMIDSLCGYLG